MSGRAVDHMIAKMQFDNGDFEKGVSETLNSLSKLRESLKMEGVAEGLSEVSDNANKINFDKLDQALDNINKRFSTLGVIGTEVLRKLTDKALSLGSALVGKVTAPVTQLGDMLKDGIVEGGKNRALNLANAKHQMQGLFQSMGQELEEAKAHAEWIVQNPVANSVQDTAYTLDEAASVASQLMASGMTDADELERTLRAVAGTAAMTSADYSSIGHIFTTIASNGKVMGEQLTQMSHYGINAAADLSRAFGIAESDIRDLVSEGAITDKMFFEAMANNYAEFSKSANDTYEGSLANMRAALSRIGEKMWTPILTDMTKVHNSAKSLIQYANEAMSSDGGVINSVNAISHSFLSFVDSLLNSDEALGVVATAVDIVDAVVKAFGATLNFVGGLIKPIGDAIVDAFGGSTDDIFGFFSGIANKIRNFASNLNDLRNDETKFGKVTNTIYTIASSVLKVLKFLGTIAASVIGIVGNGLRIILPSVVKLVEAVSPIVGFLSDILGFIIDIASTGFAGILGFIADGFTSLGDHIVGAGFDLQEFHKKLRESGPVKAFTKCTDKAKEAVKGFFSADENGKTPFDRFADRISTAKENLKKFWSSLKENENVKTFIANVKAIGASIKEYALRAFSSFIEKLNELTGTDPDLPLADRLASYVGFVAGKINDLIAKLKEAKEKIKSFIDTFRKNFKTKGLLFAVGESFGVFASKISDAFNKIKDNPLVQKIGEIFSGLYERITTFVGGIKSGNWLLAIIDLFSPVQDAFADDTISNVSGNLDTLATSIDHVGDSAAGIKDKIKEMATYFKDKFFEYTKDVDPSDVVRALLNIGLIRFVMNIAKAAVNLKKAIKAIGESFTSFGKIGSAISETIKNVGKGVTTVFDEVAGAISSTKKSTTANNLLKFAAAVAIFTGCLIALTNAVDWRDTNTKTSLIVLGSMVAVVGGIFYLLNRTQSVSPGDIKAPMKALEMISGTIQEVGNKFAKRAGMGIAIAALAAAVLIIGVAIKEFMGIDWKDAGVAIVAMGITLATLAGSIILISKLSGDNIGLGTAATIVAMAWFLKSVVNIMSILNSKEFQEGNGYIEGIFLLIGMFTALGILMSLNKGESLKGVWPVLLSMGVAFQLIARACKQFNKIDAGKLDYVVAFLVIIMGSMAAITAIGTQGKGTLRGAGLAMIGIGIGVAAIAAACAMFTALIPDPDKITKAFIFMGIVLGGLALSLWQAKSALTNLSIGASLILIAAGISIIAAACKEFTNISEEKLGYAIAFVSIIMGVMSIISIFAAAGKGWMLAVGAGLLLVAAGVSAILYSIGTALKGFDADELKMVAIMLGVIMGILAAMQLMAFNAMGALATIAVGGAMYFLGNGIAAIINAIAGLKDFTPEQLKSVSILLAVIEGIMAGMQLIAGLLPLSAAVIIVGMAAEYFADAINVILGAVNKAASMGDEGIATLKKIPGIIGDLAGALLAGTIGLYIGVNTLPGIGKGFAVLAYGAAKFIEEANKLPQAVGNLIGSLSAIERQTGVNIATWLASGMVNGMQNSGNDLMKASVGMVMNNVVGPIMRVLGIASPSKLFEWMFEMCGAGGEQGILNSMPGMSEAIGIFTDGVTTDFADGLGGLEGVFGATGEDLTYAMNTMLGDAYRSTEGGLGDLGSLFGNYAGAFDMSALFGDDAIDLSAKLDEAFGGDNKYSIEVMPNLDTEKVEKTKGILGDLFKMDDVTTAAGDLSGWFAQSIDMKPLEKAIADLKTANDQRWVEMQTLVATQNASIRTLGESMSNMQLRLDTGALVGEIADPLNRELGRIASRAQR